MENVMVDLETLGTSSNSVILSIGAVEFDKTGLGREFYVVVDPQSCVDAGLKIDVPTVLWWMKQSDEAREAFDQPDRVSLECALARFGGWFPHNATLWGNGAAFDNVVLANAYLAVGTQRPWYYHTDRCYRTLKNLRPDIGGPALEGVAHNALFDAKWQALHAVALLNALGV